MEDGASAESSAHRSAGKPAVIDQEVPPAHHAIHRGRSNESAGEPDRSSGGSASKSTTSGAAAVSKRKPALRPLETSTDSSHPAERESRASAKRKWARGELVGKGAYGNVYRALANDSGIFFAVKQVELSNVEDPSKMLRDLAREVSLLRDLRHPNIVRYYGYEWEAERLHANERAETRRRLNIFMEYVPGGSIESLLERFGPLKEQVAALYTKQILRGVQYLHKNGVVHRDIKGANILVDRQGRVKITDLGSSVKMQDLFASTGIEVKGSPYWMAPEVIQRRSFGKEADIWSIGCTVIEMLSGRPPWSERDFPSVSAFFRHVVAQVSGPGLPDSLSPEAADFLSRCLQARPMDRPDASLLLQHPFIAKARGGLLSGSFKRGADRVPVPRRSPSPRDDVVAAPDARHRRQSSADSPIPGWSVELSLDLDEDSRASSRSSNASSSMIVGAAFSPRDSIVTDGHAGGFLRSDDSDASAAEAALARAALDSAATVRVDRALFAARDAPLVLESSDEDDAPNAEAASPLRAQGNSGAPDASPGATQRPARRKRSLFARVRRIVGRGRRAAPARAPEDSGDDAAPREPVPFLDLSKVDPPEAPLMRTGSGSRSLQSSGVRRHGSASHMRARRSSASSDLSVEYGRRTPEDGGGDAAGDAAPRREGAGRPPPAPLSTRRERAAEANNSSDLFGAYDGSRSALSGKQAESAERRENQAESSHDSSSTTSSRRSSGGEGPGLAKRFVGLSYASMFNDNSIQHPDLKYASSRRASGSLPSVQLFSATERSPGDSRGTPPPSDGMNGSQRGKRGSFRGFFGSRKRDSAGTP